jgi:hypothetical protein
MKSYFEGFTLECIDRAKNAEADELAKAVAHNKPLPADVFLQVISDASIKTVEPNLRVINLIQGKDQHAPIMAYLCHYYEPDSTVDHPRMQQRARSYQIVDNDFTRLLFQAPSFGVPTKPKAERYYRRFTQELAEAT